MDAEMFPPIDDDAVELVDRELVQHLAFGGVGAHDLRELAVEGLDDVFIEVDAEHLGAGCHELERERTSESAEADHGDRVRLGDAPRSFAGAELRELSQWPAFLSEVRTGSVARGAQGPDRG